MKAMILAAGLGTRLKPLTDKIPKALIKVNGITMLEHVIIRLKKFGINEIIINVFHLAEQIEAFLKTKNNFDIRIELSFEDTLLDTGGGLKKAGWFFDDNKPFILHNCDVLSDIDFEEMLSYHIEKNAFATLAVKERKTSRYFLFDDNKYLVGWKSVKDNKVKMVKDTAVEPIPLSFLGIHIISPAIFNKLSQQNTFSIVDTYLSLAEQKEKIAAFRADDYSWLDAGKPEGLEEARTNI